MFFCTTLRGGHNPFMQAGAETPNIGTDETVKSDTGCSLKGHSGRVGADVRDESTESYRMSNHSAFHWCSAQCTAHMFLSDKLMSRCVTGTNGFLDLRHHAFTLGGRVRGQWSRCPGSMAQHARDSIA